MSNHDQVAKDYYDSDAANTFYMKIWGGENIHIGFYEENEEITTEKIRQASHKSTDALLDAIPNLEKVSRVADLGAGIGGTARSLCQRQKDLVVDCFDVSEKENETNRQLADKAGLKDRINVFGKSYTDTGATDGTYDVLLSQDAFLHCGTPDDLMKECARILKSGGYLVFTDPMQSDNADTERLQPVYQRISLPRMWSPAEYKKRFAAVGLEFVNYKELSHQMKRHYTAVKKILDEQGKEFGISDDYREKSSTGLKHWIDGVSNGDLTWGILTFQKK